ncbi:MAG TPA: EamA family transporter [Verrucomicrobiae bacterium]
MNTASANGSRQTALIIAFATIYVIWGSTYLAIRVAVETLPPFLLGGIRFLIAGGAMFAWLRWRGVPLPNRKQWLHGGIAGTLMLLGGNGLVVWAEQTVPSNLAALLVALTPAWFALLEWLRPAGKRPATHTIAGIVVGFIGVGLLVTGSQAKGMGMEANISGIVALTLAGLSWAAGSLWSRYNARHESPWMNAALQMICGGVGLLLLSCCHGEPAQFQYSQVQPQSWLALGYLILFGSWVGFSAYVWLLKATTPARLATYAYVNPIVAVLLGHLVLSEPFGPRAFGAAAIILAGVAITTLPRKA